MTGDQRQRGDVPGRGALAVVDVLLGAGASTVERVWGVGGPVVGVGRSVLVGSVRVAGALVPEPVRSGLAGRGARIREDAERFVREQVRRAVPQAVEAILGLLDLTAIVNRHVDIDAIAARIDVDAVVARADIDAAVAGVDIDAIVARLDLNAIAARLDLNALVGLVDIDAVVAGVDLDAAVAGVDLDAVVARVDTDAVVARVDLDAVVSRLDLAGIARQVIDAIDLPEIVRESTGTMASETVRGVRAQGMQADDAVERLVGRLFRRPRSGPPTAQPAAP